MTDQLAKQIFDTILEQVVQNGFSDIVTFSLHESTEEHQFSKFTEEYEYVSTDSAIQNLINQSNEPQGAIVALSRFINASVEYFSIAGEIPKKYTGLLIELLGKEDNVQDTSIRLNISDGRSVNLSEILQQDIIRQMISVLNFINRNKEQSDIIFLSELEQFFKW